MQQQIFTPTGTGFTEVKSKTSVWGDAVEVPEHSKPPDDPTTKWTRQGGDGTVHQGNGQNNQEGNQEGSEAGDNEKITEPIVVLPDGSKVDAKKFFNDAFVAKEAELTQKENRLDGMIEMTRNGAAGGADNNQGEGDQNNGQQSEENKPPLFQHMELPEDTVTEANEKVIIGEYNKNVDAMNERESFWQARDAEHKETIDELTKELKNVKDVVGQEQWQNSLARVTAVTGLKEEDLIAKYRETKIADADILSTLILGDREKDRILKEVTDQADQERENGNNAIGGQSAGSGGGTQVNTDLNKPLRGLDPEKDYDAEKLVTKYNLIKYNPYTQVA